MSLNEIPSLKLKRFSKPVDVTPEPVRQIPSSRLKLYRGSEDAGKYVSSPFVTKVEFRLRMADLPYALDAGAPWLGPKGKIPYVEVAPETKNDKPVMLGDSTLIIQHLTGENAIRELNADLSASEKSRDLGLRSLLEDKLYFYHVCFVVPSFAINRILTRSLDEGMLGRQLLPPTRTSSLGRTIPHPCPRR